MKKLISIVKLLNCFIVFLFIPTLICGQSKILINEFLIDPQPQQVELINTGAETADISGWIIDDSGGTTFYTIPQSSILYPNSCLVFSADFNLNKTTADTVRLIDNTELIDSFSYKSSSGSGVSYFRLPDGGNSWSTGSTSLGKFNSTGLSCFVSPILTPIPLTPTETGWINPSPTITDSPIPTPTLEPTSYNNIFISEAMVNPESGNNEWVEIYNNNDFTVFLTNWFIDDLENYGSSLKTFSLEIPAKSYRVYNLNSSMFNNDSDSVRLLNSYKNLKDSFEYGSSIQGKTFGRISINNDDFCFQEPSYELANTSCLNSTSNLSPAQTPSPTKTVSLISKTTIKPTRFDVSTLPAGRQVHRNNSYENVLGISSIRKPNSNLLIRVMSFISLSYSLLTILSILFKIKFIYGKGKKLFSSFIHPSGTQ